MTYLLECGSAAKRSYRFCSGCPGGFSEGFRVFRTLPQGKLGRADRPGVQQRMWHTLGVAPIPDPASLERRVEPGVGETVNLPNETIGL
jgi:hypothetical protein